ncbi:MAG TPA: alpha/beta fold hydrolase [Blastocatellia bacterium]|nr:alpha/beta fold hydrolase [Blastocatellia bacterium]
MTSRNANEMNIWFSRPRLNPNAEMRLFCFPYAGGSANIFRFWPDVMMRSVEICAANLPGRLARMMEAPFTRLTPLVHEMARVILPWTDKPFAFFGHSMGALISFELARRLRTIGASLPARLFISGRRAPHLPDPDPHRHTYPDHLFMEELGRLNGTPPEVMTNPELMQLMLPLLRADFAMCETFEYRPEPSLPCPLTVFGGLQDPEVPPESLEAWRQHTSQSFRVCLLPGDHFFLNSARNSLLMVIAQELSELEREV